MNSVRYEVDLKPLSEKLGGGWIAPGQQLPTDTKNLSGQCGELLYTSLENSS